MKNALKMCSLLALNIPFADGYGAMKEKPNVLFIVVDDLGWTDLGCYGSAFHESPNVDRLAEEGVRFTNAYACPVSSPTRVCLQTGKYAARIGTTDYIRGNFHEHRGRKLIMNNAPVLPPDNNFNMPLEEVTIAEALKQNGYRTAHVGKWHCAEDSLYFPQYQGYDINVAGCWKGNPGKSYYTPYNNDYLSDGEDGEYLTDRLTDECIKILNEYKDDSFFMHLAFYQVHTPLVGKPEKVSYFTEKAHRMGLDTVGRQLDTTAKWRDKALTLNSRIGNRTIQNNPVYAAMIQSMDENVGRVVDELKRLGIYDNTIIIFVSDNGGLSHSINAPTCNYPLEGGKGLLYEGGIRVPMIVKWPGHIKPGTDSDVPVTAPDYYPTILDMLDLPAMPEQHLDGVSFCPALEGRKMDRKRALYWHYPHYLIDRARPSGAIREGDYKLVEYFDDNTVELFNIKKDISENIDLSEKMPRKTAYLLGKLKRWQEETGAKMPVPNPKYKRK